MYVNIIYTYYICVYGYIYRERDASLYARKNVRRYAM